MRLLDVMASLPAGTAEEVIRSIEDCLNDFIDPLPLADDLTMMAILKVDNAIAFVIYTATMMLLCKGGGLQKC